jgi:hypothetical protein
VLDGAEMTVEVTERRQRPSGQWDAGGAPVLLDGRLCVIEGLRFPAGLQDRLPDFQTNSMIFCTRALDQEIPMQYYAVTKQVAGRPALQFEAITCEASSALRPDGSPLLRLGLLRVPRDGPRGRFFPIKNPVDLERTRDLLRSRLQTGWALRDGAPH